jgi:hypothetical protein
MAYLGSTVPGFPNFFMMQGVSHSTYMSQSLSLIRYCVSFRRPDTGPNTTTGHTSILFSEESQIPYLLQLLEPVRAGVLKSVAPADGATDRYNDMLQKRLEDSVWSLCASWYRVGGRGRIFSTFPGPLVLLWWWLRKVRWEDHEIEGPGAEQWRRRHARWSRKALLAMAFLTGALGAVAIAYVVLPGVELSEIVKQAVRVWSLFSRSRPAEPVVMLARRRRMLPETFGEGRSGAFTCERWRRS